MLPFRARAQSSVLKIRCANTHFKLLPLVAVKHSLITSLDGIKLVNPNNDTRFISSIT